MSSTAFLSAVLALLIAPGPTNTLMGLVGAQRGVQAVVRLLPAELAGYLSTILPLIYFGKVLGQWPSTIIVLKVVAAGWVMFLATTLWGQRGNIGSYTGVTVQRVYLTTLLNPKALIFGLILLPAPDSPQFVQKLGLFCIMVMAVALVWGTAGTFTQTGNGGSDRLLIVQRIASVWLAVVSVTLIAGVVRS